jgi:hypothetical protein
MLYRALAALGAAAGLASGGLASLMVLSAALVGPMGLVFGIGEWGWYETWGMSLINLIMHLLPGVGAAVLAAALLAISALLLWGAMAAWRRATVA